MKNFSITQKSYYGFHSAFRHITYSLKLPLYIALSHSYGITLQMENTTVFHCLRCFKDVVLLCSCPIFFICDCSLCSNSPCLSFAHYGVLLGSHAFLSFEMCAWVCVCVCLQKSKWWPSFFLLWHTFSFMSLFLFLLHCYFHILFFIFFSFSSCTHFVFS